MLHLAKYLYRNIFIYSLIQWGPPHVLWVNCSQSWFKDKLSVDILWSESTWRQERSTPVFIQYIHQCVCVCTMSYFCLIKVQLLFHHAAVAWFSCQKKTLWYLICGYFHCKIIKTRFSIPKNVYCCISTVSDHTDISLLMLVNYTGWLIAVSCKQWR